MTELPGAEMLSDASERGFSASPCSAARGCGRRAEQPVPAPLPQYISAKQMPSTIAGAKRGGIQAFLARNVLENTAESAMKPSIKVAKLLWPTDFSELSLRAAGFAAALQEQFETELHIVHACPIITASEMVSWNAGIRPVAAYQLADAQANELDELRLAAQRLRAIAAHWFRSGCPVVCRVLRGLVWQAICSYAQDTQIDLIVLATHGRTGLRHVLMGSTAEVIVRNAPCPVLTVKAMEKDFITSPRAFAPALCGEGI